MYNKRNGSSRIIDHKTWERLSYPFERQPGKKKDTNDNPVITSGVSENVRILVLTDKLIGLIKWRRQDWGTCSQSTCPKTRIREEGQQG
jgi:hypothetical protein